MSNWIDKKYINLISYKLPLFEWKSDSVAEFRCPICGDSKKNNRKKRGVIFRAKDSYRYYCHNCAASMWVWNYFNNYCPEIFQEYKLEKLKAKFSTEWKEDIPQEKETYVPPNISVEQFDSNADIVSVDSLADNHFAKKYVRDRKIPEKYWKELKYTSNYKKWVNENIDPTSYADNKETADERIVIPFFNSQKQLIALQGRYIGEDKYKRENQRYLTQKINKKSVLLYGLDRATLSETLYCFEGPIDSLFVNNSCAAAGSALKKLFKSDKDIVYVFDNQPRKQEIVDLMEDAINRGKKVVIFPDEIQEKDINDMVLAGISNIEDILKQNTYRGIKAKLRFSQWKRI